MNGGVNPARAGMILIAGPYLHKKFRKPRASGDDPCGSASTRRWFG